MESNQLRISDSLSELFFMMSPRTLLLYSILKNQMARGKAPIKIKRKVLKLTKSYISFAKRIEFLFGVSIIGNYKD